MSGLWEQCRALTDEQLITGLAAATDTERRALASLLVHLAEFDTRRLAETTAYPSLYLYCTRHLHYSEDAAYMRIRAAKTVRRFPMALDLLESGEIHLRAIVYLTPHLTEQNHAEVLDQARGKSNREVEEMVSGFEPRTARPDSVRPFSTPAPALELQPIEPEFSGLGLNGAGASAACVPPQVPDASAGKPAMVPKDSPSRLGARLSFDVDFEVLAKLERARQVLSNKYHPCRLKDVFDEGLEALLDKKDIDRRIRRRLLRRERHERRA